jgi:hypothetical protein
VDGFQAYLVALAGFAVLTLCWRKCRAIERLRLDWRRDTRNVPRFHCAAGSPLFEVPDELLTDALLEAQPFAERTYMTDRRITEIPVIRDRRQGRLS